MTFSRDEVRAHLDLLLLSIVERGAGHGYEMIQRLRERSGGELDLAEGTLYPALRRLEEGGLLASDWQTVAGRRRRVYRLTGAGREELTRRRREWHLFSGIMARLVETP
jgi:DNA-binding PadR family transcriptional regulator